MSNALTIHKEMLKKQHEQSPLGKLERKLRKVYDGLVLKNEKLPEDIAKQVYTIRDENEKWQMDYIDERVKKDRIAVDEKLLESMSKELEILNSNGY